MKWFNPPRALVLLLTLSLALSLVSYPVRAQEVPIPAEPEQTEGSESVEPVAADAEVSAQPAAVEPAAASPPAAEVLWWDDFSDPGRNSFAQNEFILTAHGYDNGEYYIVSLPGWYGQGIARHYAEWVDFKIEVDVRLAKYGGYGAAFLGVRSGYTGFVRFQCSASGWCRFARINRKGNDGGWTTTYLNNFVAAPTLNKGTGLNRIALSVKGSRYTGYVNGREVSSVDYGELGGGGFVVGVLVPPGDTGEARFDNLVVTRE